MHDIYIYLYILSVTIEILTGTSGLNWSCLGYHFASWKVYKVIKANGLIKKLGNTKECMPNPHSPRPSLNVINVTHKTHIFFSSSEIRCTIQYTADFIAITKVLASYIWG